MFEITVITAVPGFWSGMGSRQAGLVGRAFEEEKTRLNVVDLRDFGLGPQKQIDDLPYGGGPGMLLRPEPAVAAIRAARSAHAGPVLMMGPSGRHFSQGDAQQWSQSAGMILVCPRYEGIDSRVEAHVDHVVSIGDVILSGGDPAALILLDAVVRLLPEVLGNPDSLANESFGENGLLEHPQFTRPADFEGVAVPEVLRSGNHGAVERWRQTQSEALTQQRRPDLWKKWHKGSGSGP